MHLHPTRLWLLVLLAACGSMIAVSAWPPAAEAENRDALCDGHEDEHEHEHEGEHDEEEWEDEDWEMEEAMFEVEILNQHLEMVNRLIEIVNGTSEVTNDPTATALMALISAKELAGEPEQYVFFLEVQLPKVQDVAVRRAIHLQLAETYAELEMPDKVKEHLGTLIQGKN